MVLMVLLASCMTMPALADPGEEKFTVTYRFEVQEVMSNTQSGYLLINVMNISDEPVNDLSVWVPNGANPALPHLPVQIGDLNAGYGKEVLEVFKTPVIVNDPEMAAVWRIEFTDAMGEKRQIDVIGQIGI